MTASTAILTSLAILVGLAVLRQVRIYLFGKELFWESDPIIEADKWEGTSVIGSARGRRAGGEAPTRLSHRPEPPRRS